MNPLDFAAAVDKVVNQVKEVHPNIAVLSRLSNLLREPETALDDLAQLIKSEPSLTADIIKISNSACYGGANECSDVESALTRIGFNNVLKVVSLVLTKNLCSIHLKQYCMGPDDLWAESVTTSLLMETLAPAAGLNDSIAATAGILHNVGRVIINNLLEFFGIDLPWDGSIPVTEWEQSRVGFHYGEAGARFLKEMNFPDEMQQILRHHVDPAKAPVGAPLMTHVLHYCVQLTDTVGRGFSNSTDNFPDTSFLKPHVDLSHEDVCEAVDEAKSRYEEINQNVSVGV